MNKIKRYDCYSTNEYGEATIDWDENETGEYIKSEDFDKYDRTQKASIAMLEAELTFFKD